MAHIKVDPEFQETLNKMVFGAIATVQENKQNKDGAFYVEVMKVQLDQIKELAKINPMAQLLADFTITRSVCAGKIWVNSDFSKLSMFPLDGFKNWEEKMATEFKGYKLDCKPVSPESTIILCECSPVL